MRRLGSRARTVAVALILSTVLPFSSIASALHADEVSDGAPGVERVIVWNGAGSGFMRALAAVTPFKLVYTYEIISGVAVAVPERKVDAVIDFARSMGLRAEPDHQIRASMNLATRVTHVKSTGSSTGAWADGYTGAGSSVAVLDTGINAAHVALNDQDLTAGAAAKVIAFRNCTAGCTAVAPFDDNGHGSNTAGVVGSTGQSSSGDGPSGRGHVGVAYGANLVGIKVLDSEGTGSSTDSIAAINWVVANRNSVSPPIRVMNLSYGAIPLPGENDGTSAEAAALNNAVLNNGLVAVVAAGNGTGQTLTPNAQDGNVGMPADAEHVITACSTTDVAPPAAPTFSNWDSEGPTADGRVKPDICAPGETVNTPAHDSNTAYGAWTGTSESSPHIAGIAALMLQAVPTLTPPQIKLILSRTASHSGGNCTTNPTSKDNDRGWGAARAKAAIDCAIALFGSPDVTPPSGITGLSASPGDGRVSLSWNAATDDRFVDHYSVYRDGIAVSTPASNADTVTGLTNGVTYTFQVRAFDAAGNQGPLSAAVTATPVAAPATTGWPQFHNDLARTGSAAGSSTLDTSQLLQTLSLGGRILSSPLAADLDGDGKNEVVVLNDSTSATQPMTVRAYEHDDSGVLQQVWSSTVPNGFEGEIATNGFGSLAIGQLAGDDKPEIAVYFNYEQRAGVPDGPAATSNIGGLRILKGDGSLLTAAAAGQIGIGISNHPAIGDVTGDGVNDVVLVRDSGDTAAVPGYYLQGYTVSGTALTQVFDSFVNATLIATNPVLADLRAGRAGLEVILAVAANPGSIYVCSPAAGNANCVVKGSAASWPHGIAISDLDGNGGLDLVVNAETNALHVLKWNSGSETFSAPVTLADGFLYNTPTIADVTGDGKPDIVNVDKSNLLNEGDPFQDGDVTVRSFTGTALVAKGTFARTSGTPGQSSGAGGGGALADLNAGDGGRPEFVFGSDDGKLVAVKFSAAGAPSLLWEIPIASAAPFSPPAISDVTGDGKVDVLIGTSSGNLLVIGRPGTAVNPPGAPTGLAAIGGNAQVDLTWSAPASNGGAPITNYKVFRGTASGNVTFLADAGTGTSFSDATVTNGTTYFYTVAAENSAGVGAQSNESSATPTAPATVPGAPTGLGASGGNNQVSLAWAAPADDGGAAITNYKVYRSETSGSEAFLADAGPSGTYSDTTAVNGTTYFYTVAAENAVGVGPQSNEASATPSNDASLSIDPSSISFGDQRTGTTSSAQIVTVTNTGTSTLSVGNVVISGTNAADFSTTADTCSNTSVPIGGTCTVGVRFGPSDVGARAGTLFVPSNAGTSPDSVALSGNGTAPAVSIAPSSLTFASQNLGSTSAAQTVTVTNTGTATLEVGTVDITGANAGDFLRANDTCASQSIGVGGSCSVDVSFQPTAHGARSASLQIASSASGSPHLVPLAGDGVGAAGVSSNPASLTFGSVFVGTTSAAQNVTVTNSGTAPLSLGTLSVGGADAGDFLLSSDGCSGSTLAISGTCTFGAKFKPTAGGELSAIVSIPSNASGSPHSVALQGTGVVGTPVAKTTPTSIAFGGVVVGSTSTTKSVLLQNAGSGLLAVASVTFTGTDASQFTKIGDSCTGKNLAAGASCTVTLRFKPTTGGAKTADLSFATNAAGSPANVALTGSGLVDEAAPETTITTEEGEILIAGLDRISGKVTDDVLGVSKVTVQFGSALGFGTVNASISGCNAQRTSCNWSATVPVTTAGPTTVDVWATDAAGRVEDPAKQVSVVVI